LCFPSEYPFRFGTFLQEFPPKFLKNLVLFDLKTPNGKLTYDFTSRRSDPPYFGLHLCHNPIHENTKFQIRP